MRRVSKGPSSRNARDVGTIRTAQDERCCDDRWGPPNVTTGTEIVTGHRAP
jgi:hypothetical protein